MKQNKKLVSFDVWGTLFESNPEYKAKREEIIKSVLLEYDFFKNSSELKELNIWEILKIVKKDVDNVVELYWLSPTPYQLYEWFLNQIIRKYPSKVSLDLSPKKISGIVLKIIKEANLLLEDNNNRPNLIVHNTKKYLEDLINEWNKLVVMSNTMNMWWKQLWASLIEAVWKEIFEEMFFSDQVKASKPSPKMYWKIINYWKNNWIPNKDIIHVWDNFITDWQVTKYGMEFMHIEPKNSQKNLGAITDSILKWNVRIYVEEKSWEQNIENFSPERRRVVVQQFSSKNDMNFSPEEYSRFKFWSKKIARKFWEELAQKLLVSNFFEEIINLVKSWKKIIVVSSPYIHIPTATYAMKDYFISKFNHYLAEKWIEPVLEVKMSRKSSYQLDYWELNAKQREEIMKNDIFHIDYEYLKWNIVLFLDDIIITGWHEKRIMQMLKHYNLIWKITPFFLYYAMLTDNKTDPQIENYLNYASLKNLLDLNKIISNEPYALNTRMVKYILNAPNTECKSFLDYQSDTFLHTLYSNALWNRYHKIEEYKENMWYLKDLLRIRWIKLD